MKRNEFLQRLIGISGLGFLSLPEVESKQKIYLLQTFVAGFRFYKGVELLQHMQQNDFVELRREPDNEHDPFAVALYWQQEKVGFLPAESNETIARLLDAEALHLIGVITHLKQDVQPWENVVVGVYFLSDKNPLPPHASYLTQLAKPEYRTIKTEKQSRQDHLPYVTDYEGRRIIDPNGINDEAAKAYFEKYYTKQALQINGKTYLEVPDDGIYSYVYNVESAGWLYDEKGNKYLEFIFNEE